jgi:NTP pyrophosphatase (non-canonical NTP hydrolase)
MTFDEYQKESRRTAVYPQLGANIVYPSLKLCGESGEVAEKVGKLIRDREGKVDDAFRQDLAKELGDVLWYVGALCSELGLSMDDVARGNLEKLKSRQQRGVIHGSGDNR